MFQKVMVDYYGAPTPLQQLASFQTPEARTIIISPFDKSSMHAIEKAIQQADLGVNPSNDGNIIRCTMPLLTEERRREYVKMAHTEAEEARVSVRNVRRSAKTTLEKLVKDGEVGEDEGTRAEKELESVTKRHVDQIDEESKRARLVFTGRDTRGMGSAQGASAAHFVGIEGGRTRVELDTDVQFSGKAAQMGRPNVVNDVSQTLVGKFAHCLQIQLTGSADEAMHAREDSSKPLSGITVMGAAAKGAVGRLFHRDKDDTDNDEGKGDAT